MKKNIFLISILLLVSVSGIASENKTANFDESLWKRIDQLNEKIKSAPKPISEVAFAKLLQEASSLAASKEMRDDYRLVRYESNDSSVEQMLAKRAKPGLYIAYGGDWELTEVTFATFKSLVNKNSNLDRFLNAYEKYTLYIIDKSPGGLGPDCPAIEFNFIRADEPRMNKYKNKLKPFISELKDIRKALKEDYLLSAVDQAIKCLEK